MNDYDPIELARDATAFAESNFGKHYLARLAKVRDGHYSKARSQTATDTEIAREMARADEIDGELAYFAQAKEISTNPSLIKRIRESLQRKEKKTEEQV